MSYGFKVKIFATEGRRRGWGRFILGWSALELRGWRELLGRDRLYLKAAEVFRADERKSDPRQSAALKAWLCSGSSRQKVGSAL